MWNIVSMIMDDLVAENDVAHQDVPSILLSS